MAIAVQCALTCAVGLYAPRLRAQQIACPTGSLTINAAGATNATNPCNISSGLSITGSGTLDNSGTLTSNFGTVLSNSGTLTNNSGGTLINSSVLRNYSGATLNNSGTLTIDSGGSALVNFGVFNNNTGGTLTNNGNLQNYSGATLSNSGTLTNNQALRNYGALNNNTGGTLTNTELLRNYSGATLSNSGTLNNNDELYIDSGATLTNNGTLNNSLRLYNYGTLNNNTGGTLTSSGSLYFVSGTVNNNGTLSSSGFLANYTGATLNNSGTLTNTGTLQNRSGATLNNNAGGTINNNSGATFTNNGTLNNNSGATLTNSYILRNYNGATLGNSGTLTNNTGGFLGNYGTLNNNAGGSLTNSGTLYNYPGATLSNSGTLTNSYFLVNRSGATFNNSGTLTNNLVLRNYGTLNNNAGATLTNSNSLQNYSGATFSNSGTLTNSSGGTLRNSGTLNNNTGGTLTNNGILRNQSGATLSNSGTLTNSYTLRNYGALNNGGTFTITSSGSLTQGAYFGSFAQSAGTLRVDGTLTQNAVTIYGGTLTGTGTINAPVNNSGSLLPGAVGTPGTLTINGNLTQNAGATLVVHINPTQASRVTINGTASLAGTVQVVPVTGTYPNTPFTILSATGGVTGTFSGVTSTSAFVSPALTYDPNNVFLTLTQVASFSSVAQTPNELAVSTLLGLIQTGNTGNTDMQSIISQINSLSPAEARNVFNSLGGTWRPGADFGAQTGAINNLIRVLMNRIGGGGGMFGGVGFAPGPIHLAAGRGVISDANPVYAQAGPATAGGFKSAPQRDGAWALVYGNDGKTTGDTNAPGYKQDGVGFAFGADREINSQWRAGAAINIGNQRARADAGAGRVDSDGVSVAAYARYTDGPLSVNTVAGAGRGNNDSARIVTVAGTTRVASAEYDSTQRFAYVEGAYAIPMKSYTLSPVVALGYTRIANDAYSETGAGALNLIVSEQARESIKSYVGVRTTHQIGDGKGLTLNVRALWSHEFGNVDNAISTAQFAGAPGVFQTQGIKLNRDGAVLGLGLSGELRRNLALFGDVAVEARSKQHNATFQAGVRYSW